MPKTKDKGSETEFTFIRGNTVHGFYWIFRRLGGEMVRRFSYETIKVI